MIPTRAHEVLHLEIYNIVIQGTTFQNWTSIGSTTFRGNGLNEPDSSGGPKPGRLGNDCWPTLVIRAGYSSTLNTLHQAMRWWFRESHHDVKIVILAKFDSHRNQYLKLEKWEEALPQGPITRSRDAGIQAAAGTPQTALLEPVLRQTITINRRATPPLYHVTRGPLVLGFRQLFLRNPGMNEGDIVMSVTQLEEYAARVWEVVPSS